MPRRRRPGLPGIPLHVVQRGVNRSACFLVDGDRERYLHWLAEAAALHACSIHAYVLMGNHVHLLMTPETDTAASRVMHALGTRYVAYFNRRHGRTGVLWERRFRACLVDTDSYLLRCHRYIELNPVRARMVVHPSEYRWSSYRHYASGFPDRVLSPHSLVVALAQDEAGLRRAYRSLCADHEDDWSALRRESERCGAFGGDEFRRRVAGHPGFSDLDRTRGRPATRGK